MTGYETTHHITGLYCLMGFIMIHYSLQFLIMYCRIVNSVRFIHVHVSFASKPGYVIVKHT